MQIDNPDVDYLTGAFGRASFNTAMQHIDAFGPLTLWLLDLDHFKTVNDAFGHARGDAVLAEFGYRVRGLLRSSDLLFRLGGDEFALLLPNTDSIAARAIIARVVAAVQGVPMSGTPPLNVTMSGGGAAFPGDGIVGDALFALADRRLYLAKRNGRACVIDTNEVLSQPHLAVASRVIERDRTMAQIYAFIDRLSDGERGAVRIVGPRGVGHSRMLIETAQLAHLRGFAVLHLHGGPSCRFRAFAYLETAIDLPGEARTAEANPSAWVAALVARAQLCNGLLIVADALDECDAASAELIDTVLHHPELRCVGLVAACPGDAPSGPAFADLPTLRLPLEPLSPAGLQLWLRSALGTEPHPDLVAQLHRVSGGLPACAEAALGRLRQSDLLMFDDGVAALRPDRTDDVRQALAAPRDAPRTLPPLTRTLVGRGRELGVLKQLVATHQIIMVVGEGGVGKARLVAQLGYELWPAVRDGVILIDLAPLRRPDFIACATLDAFGEKLDIVRIPTDQLLGTMAERETLLIFTNVERVADFELLAALVACSATLRIVVTSTRPLPIVGAELFELRGLRDGVPDDAMAMRLFWQSATAHDLVQNADTDALVGQLFRRLRGHPLAIELAAAWARDYSLPVVLNHLVAQLDKTDSESPVFGIFIVIWRTLSPRERRAVQNLAVFVAGFSFDAAWQVANVSFFLLSALLNKSLVTYDGQGRYVIHPALARFLQEQLAADRAAHYRAHRRYATFYTRLAATHAGPVVTNVAELERQIDHLRAVLGWLIDIERDATAAGRLVMSLCVFWQQRGYGHEGRTWIGKLVGLAGWEQLPHKRRMRDLHWLAQFHAYCGDIDLAMVAADRGLTLGHADGVCAEQINLLLVQCWLRYLRGEPECVVEDGLHALALVHQTRQLRLYPAALQLVALGYDLLGDRQRAEQQYREAILCYRSLGDLRGVAATLHNLGAVLESTAGCEAALTCYAEALAIDEQLGDVWHVYCTRHVMADTLLAADRYIEADTVVRSVLDFAVEHTFPLGGPLATLAESQIGLAQYSIAQGTATRALETSVAEGRPRAIGHAHAMLGLATRWIGEMDAARAQLEIGLAICERVGAVALGAKILRHWARAEQSSGAREHAAALEERANALAARPGGSISEAKRLIFLEAVS